MLMKELTKQKSNAINMHQKKLFQETEGIINTTAEAIAVASSMVQSTSLGTLNCLREFKPSWNKIYEHNKWRHFLFGVWKSGLNWPRKTSFSCGVFSARTGCHTRGHDTVVPGSPFQPSVQSIVVLECPSEAGSGWQKGLIHKNKKTNVNADPWWK